MNKLSVVAILIALLALAVSLETLRLVHDGLMLPEDKTLQWYTKMAKYA